MPKILIVDDPSNPIAFLEDVLSKMGYALYKAEDGPAGLALFRHERPDLTFLSVGLDEGKGWETLKKIKGEDEAARVVLVARDPLPNGEEKAARAGCVGYVVKQGDPQAFLKNVSDLAATLLSSSKEVGARFKGRVLVVDDELVIRSVLERFLKSKGYDVVTAKNGKDALALAKRHRPHLMLLDMRMPDMDGLEVLKAVHEADPQLAVMMITANFDQDLAKKTMELGACDYIIKPFHLNYLETTVIAKLLLVTS